MSSGSYNAKSYKPVEYEILDDTPSEMQIISREEKPREFKGKYERQPDGTNVLVVTTQNETIVRPDGSKDVIIHAPTLELMNKFHETNKK